MADASTLDRSARLNALQARADDELYSHPGTVRRRERVVACAEAILVSEDMIEARAAMLQGHTQLTSAMFSLDVVELLAHRLEAAGTPCPHVVAFDLVRAALRGC